MHRYILLQYISLLRVSLLLLLQIFICLDLIAESCEYKLDPASLKVKWRAYKYTEKIGLEGTFEKIQTQYNLKSSTFEEFAESVKFSIDTNSITTKNDLRDNKLKSIFFSNLIEGKEIFGEFRNLKIKDDLANIDLLLKFNQKEINVPFKLIFANNKIIELKGKINILQWNVSKAFDLLIKECQQYLKGKDNIPKLWTDIDIYIYSEIIINCKK